MTCPICVVLMQVRHIHGNIVIQRRGILTYKYQADNFQNTLFPIKTNKAQRSQGHRLGRDLQELLRNRYYCVQNFTDKMINVIRGHNVKQAENLLHIFKSHNFNPFLFPPFLLFLQQQIAQQAPRSNLFSSSF